jgi:hypothetical protein
MQVAKCGREIKNVMAEKVDREKLKVDIEVTEK